jgi:hypothetical protein
MADNKRHWDDKRGRGWQRILEGPDKGHWEYYDNWAPTGKIDKRGVKDVVSNTIKGAQNLTQQYIDRQTRLTDEAISKYKPKSPKDEAINWFNAVIEDPGLSDQVRTPLIQASFGMQNAFELEDTDTMTWAQSIAKQDANQDLTETVDKVKKDNKQTEVDTDSGLQPDEYRESTFEKGKETTSKIGEIGDENWTKDPKYDRTDPSQRHARRMEDALAKGRPSEQFRLNQERNRGTPISELFHKDKRRR